MNCQRKKMDETKLYRVLDKIGKNVTDVKTTQTDMKVTQAVHTEQLKEHMRRTELLEDRQDKHETTEHEALQRDMKPAMDLVKQTHGALKLIGLLAAIVGIILGVSRFV